MKKRNGISLIVLVITIIVIIILSTAIIVSVVSNNPIDEANIARYETDRDSMQAVFTNTVTKIMAKNQGTVSVTATQINSQTSGVSSAIGEVSYTVINAVNNENASGKIVFDKGENTDTMFYTGKQLPIYKAGDTKWYVDDEGVISLDVAGNIYGEGKIILMPGTYDSNGTMLASWDELVNDYGLDIASNYTNSTYNTAESSMYSVLNNNENLSTTTKIVIDDSVTNIGDYAFSYCSGVTNITISDSVTNIGQWAFRNCSELTSIIIPDHVTSIEMGTFNGCNKLTSAAIGNSVENIATGAFYQCSGLTSVTLPNSLKNIGSMAFGSCSQLTSVIIPDSVTSIGSSAFQGCSGLTSLTIGNSVTSISSGTFNGCTSITSIKIPKSVTSIGSQAFVGCNGLTSIVVDENNTVYDSRENCNAIIEKSSNKLIQGCNVSIILDSVTSIGEAAFSGYRGLTSIGTVGSGASLEIPSSVTSIGSIAFNGCINLTSVTISDSVINIGARPFNGCSSLESIKVDENNTVYNSKDNCNAIIKTSTNNLIQGCQNTIIPESVTSISDWAFCGASGLMSITIPEKVKTIGKGAFAECRGLTSITIPDLVTTIASNAFANCENLTTIYYKGTATGAPWGAPSATVVTE